MMLKNDTLPKNWKYYPREQSPLFCLKSKRRLAALLYRKPSELHDVLRQPVRDRFCIRPQTTKGKMRIVQVPRGDLKRIHKRLFCLLNQIQLPDYVYSGRRKRSYIDNAGVHVGGRVIYKLDIRHFFESVLWGDVFRFFRRDMQCEADVAGVLSDLCTVDPGASSLCAGGHIPRGSPVSMALAYWSFAPMFNSIFHLAHERQIKMTLYVDDITFSGEDVPKAFVREARVLIGSYGLHAHKEQGWAPWKKALVTGVLVTRQGVRLPNKRRQNVMANVRKLKRICSLRKRYAHLKVVVGQLCEARQLDPQFETRTEYFKQLLRSLKKQVEVADRKKKRRWPYASASTEVHET